MELFATAIRSDAVILGIQVGKIEHKIGLYVDDVLLILTDPLRSLSVVSRTIWQLSLYKVNATKSQMLGIHKPQSLRTLTNTVFSWAPKIALFIWAFN